ncbi:type II toxin-antitoxin system RelE family toxin [Amaricoccus solimangrovi]|uniref:Type II toxin-antitoxin system RelE/ParE family toxin n=1 Tax=Amaricoccus solimangrovi TaxID=2589815 RepID=A0A501WFF3_9RHOB|nr:type II toxin-antitoxin system RelE/ParE family toxin [Amaricoccus solimangrovi]TPE47215.1 type II toxin-antitoxin system RelE/ParE family toxin [Amaricoccus solimangrovi]
MKPISYSKEALKTLRRMPANTSGRIREKIEAYAADPASQANNVKALQGAENTIRLRVGDWRVIMEETAVIAVIRVAARGGAY